MVKRIVIALFAVGLLAFYVSGITPSQSERVQTASVRYLNR